MISCTKSCSITIPEPACFAYFKFDNPGPSWSPVPNSMGTGDLISGGIIGVESIPGKLNTTLAQKAGFAGVVYGIFPPDPNWFLGNSFTIRFWWKPIAVPGSYILFMSESSFNIWQVYIDSDGVSNQRIEFVVSTNGGLVDLFAPDVGLAGLNQWYHVVCWFEDGVGAGIRINDAVTVTQADPSGIVPYTNSGIDYSLIGKTLTVIDELCFWKKKLSAADITFDYNGGAGRSYP